MAVVRDKTRVDTHYRVYDAVNEVFYKSDNGADYFVAARFAQYEADRQNTYRGTNAQSWVVVKVEKVDPVQAVFHEYEPEPTYAEAEKGFKS